MALLLSPAGCSSSLLVPICGSAAFYSRLNAIACFGVCRKECRRHEMFIDEKRS